MAEMKSISDWYQPIQVQPLQIRPREKDIGDTLMEIAKADRDAKVQQQEIEAQKALRDAQLKKIQDEAAKTAREEQKVAAAIDAAKRSDEPARQAIGDAGRTIADYAFGMPGMPDVRGKDPLPDTVTDQFTPPANVTPDAMRKALMEQGLFNEAESVARSESYAPKPQKTPMEMRIGEDGVGRVMSIGPDGQPKLDVVGTPAPQGPRDKYLNTGGALFNPETGEWLQPPQRPGNDPGAITAKVQFQQFSRDAQNFGAQAGRAETESNRLSAAIAALSTAKELDIGTQEYLRRKGIDPSANREAVVSQLRLQQEQASKLAQDLRSKQEQYRKAAQELAGGIDIGGGMTIDSYGPPEPMPQPVSAPTASGGTNLPMTLTNDAAALLDGFRKKKGKKK